MGGRAARGEEKACGSARQSDVRKNPRRCRNPGYCSPTDRRVVCEQMGLGVAPVSSQIVQRDRHAHFMTTLALLGSSLEKMAQEIRHLQRTELSEVFEPFASGQQGSSAMPHKRNPELC